MPEGQVSNVSIPRPKREQNSKEVIDQEASDGTRPHKKTRTKLTSQGGGKATKKGNTSRWKTPTPIPLEYEQYYPKEEQRYYRAVVEKADKTRARNPHMSEQVIIDIESSEEEKDHATKGTHETDD
ncbi:hypothetical protein GOP47_0005445 [Adiantum capillus-veneris]|uniref:Uncharacterized protein n=1 Tax=Adiantum capillus-veneris TaxID=13818 RepID=A0A9D4V536_ADICA|nr:hypothetical protein GOP47_0005445 [Adiantum capillus-veneris]